MHLMLLVVASETNLETNNFFDRFAHQPMLNLHQQFSQLLALHETHSNYVCERKIENYFIK